MMMDRVLVTTENLNQWARQLDEVRDNLQDALSDLRHVDPNVSEAGDVRVRINMNLRSCDCRLSAGSIAAGMEAILNGVRRLENAVERTGRGAKTSARLFEAAEREILSGISGISVGNAGRRGAGTSFLSYTPQYRDCLDVLNRNKTEWESRDEFINTQYNRDLMDRLRDAILNDPEFSETRWNECTTRGQREAFIRAMYNRIQEIYQTNLSQDIIFVYNEDYVEKKKILFWEYDKELEEATVTLEDGTTQTLDKYAVGGYSLDTDTIMINPDKCHSYEDIVGLLCHENRHNLQMEIMEAENLDKYDGVNGEDLEAVTNARDQWQHDKDNYFSPTQKDIDKREKEIKREMDWDQWWNERDRAEGYAYTELYEDYAEQQLEVDARYAEDRAQEWVRQQNVTGGITNGIASV